MSEFRNNLRKGDRVVHADTKRPGSVAFTPKGRQTAVTWQGTKVPSYCDVMTLRLVLDDKGTLDDVPPVDGEPPALEGTAAKRGHAGSIPKAPAAPASALDALKAERDGIAARMRALEDEFRGLKQRREKLDQAITVLTAPAGG
jgi:hypothetical protein